MISPCLVCLFEYFHEFISALGCISGCWLDKRQRKLFHGNIRDRRDVILVALWKLNPRSMTLENFGCRFIHLSAPRFLLVTTEWHASMPSCMPCHYIVCVRLAFKAQSTVTALTWTNWIALISCDRSSGEMIGTVMLPNFLLRQLLHEETSVTAP